MYQTNNASGLRVIDIHDRANPIEVGFFDTTPKGKNVAGFDGTWSSYPYFKSGCYSRDLETRGSVYRS